MTAAARQQPLQRQKLGSSEMEEARCQQRHRQDSRNYTAAARTWIGGSNGDGDMSATVEACNWIGLMATTVDRHHQQKWRWSKLGLVVAAAARRQQQRRHKLLNVKKPIKIPTLSTVMATRRQKPRREKLGVAASVKRQRCQRRQKRQ